MDVVDGDGLKRYQLYIDGAYVDPVSGDWFETSC